MKQLTCEMCGSTDLIKQDGVFICQSCGTKYSIEEAKKMMVEGTVDVTGSTVKVDTSDELANLYQLARRAKDADNAENAAKYYEMILLQGATNWEATFYSVYFQAKQCELAEVGIACKSIVNCIPSVLQLIHDHVDGEENQIKCLQEVQSKSFEIALMLLRKTYKYYAISRDVDRYIQDETTANQIASTVGDGIYSIWGDSSKGVQEVFVKAWKNVVFFSSPEAGENLGIYDLNSIKDKERMQEYIRKVQNYEKGYAELIQKRMQKYTKENQNYEKDYAPPKANGSNGGCYVATAVYGSYDCPQVWTLRRYRDYTLAETWYGRAFVRAYYAISPTLVKWFGHTEWFKKMWKGRLDRMVANLNAEGVEDTPYVDQEW